MGSSKATDPIHVAAIVLAAGESRRMGASKPLLRFGPRTFLEHLIETFASSSARPILVVLGHEAERILREVSLGSARPVMNPDYRRGMLSSVRAGIRAVANEPVSGALVCPVDHPWISAELVNLLIQRFAETERPIVLPVHEGRRGHPVLFARSLFQELLGAPDAVGARQVVWQHRDEVLEVATSEAGACVDVDTPDDYRKLVERTHAPDSG